VPISHLITCNFKSRFIAQALGQEKLLDNRALFAECEQPVSTDQIPRLNETEKRVLIALRKHPEMKKSEIAKKVGIQQSSLSEVFKTLQKKGVINYVRTLDPRKLPGSDVATFTWVEMKQPIMEDEQKTIENVVMKVPQVYRMSYTRTFVLIESFFSSLDKAESSHITLLEALGDNIKAFNFKIVPCSHLTTLYHPFFLEQIFGTSV